MMKEWMKSGDGMLKRAKKAITKAMPANRSVVDNTKNPASAHSMTQRKIKNTLPADKQKNKL